MKVGVLALQGAVAEHIRSITLAGAEGVPIKKVEQLGGIDGLIIPGGESTTISKLMRKYDFMDAIRQFSAQGKPIFGTCAGLIVLAERIQGDEEAHLKLMDITVARNAFGRQRESFETDLPVKESRKRYAQSLFVRRSFSRWVLALRFCPPIRMRSLQPDRGICLQLPIIRS